MQTVRKNIKPSKSVDLWVNSMLQVTINVTVVNEAIVVILKYVFMLDLVLKFPLIFIWIFLIFVVT